MCLTDGPFPFDPSFVRASWEVAFARNPNAGRINYTAEMAFFPQLAFGATGVLARLRARIECRALLLDLLYPPGAVRPAPFTPAELAALAV